MTEVSINGLKAQIYDIIVKRNELAKVYKVLGEKELKLRKELADLEASKKKDEKPVGTVREK